MLQAALPAPSFANCWRTQQRCVAAFNPSYPSHATVRLNLACAASSAPASGPSSRDERAEGSRTSEADDAPRSSSDRNRTAPRPGSNQRRPGARDNKQGAQQRPSGRAKSSDIEEDNSFSTPKPVTQSRYRDNALVLDEQHPMYTPALTDEDLAEDPPGHKSGYVAVIGKPNAGKSTLINAVVGQKLSIVSYKPQTTRHRIVGIVSDKDYQMIFFDTPGIIEERRNKLEERMMSAVVTSIHNSEAIIAVVDSRNNPKEALAMFQPGDNWTGPPMAVLLNKADLLKPEEIEALSAWYKEHCKAEVVFSGSVLHNPEVVQQVKEWAVSKMPEGPTLYPKGIVSEQPERFFVAEIIREKIFLLYEQEVPYSTQVQITEFHERKGKKDCIKATVLVEKESQVGILIGRGGKALKKLGEEARKDIEDFLERPVYLELSVQCAQGWRQDKEALEKFGYFDPILI